MQIKEEIEVGFVLIVVFGGLVEVRNQNATTGGTVKVDTRGRGSKTQGVLEIEVGFDT